MALGGGPTRAHRGIDQEVVHVGGGPVGSRLLGRARVFRYEVRCWRGGEIPDLAFAVGRPNVVSTVDAEVARVLDVVAGVPTPVWGRDELGAGEMWNSNAVVSWTLARTGLLARAGSPPRDGRAPGWDAGIEVARRQAAVEAAAQRGDERVTTRS
jgi:hypothetical protein